MNIRKKILSLLLAIFLLTGLIPVAAYATEDESQLPPLSEGSAQSDDDTFSAGSEDKQDDDENADAEVTNDEKSEQSETPPRRRQFL